MAVCEHHRIGARAPTARVLQMSRTGAAHIAQMTHLCWLEAAGGVLENRGVAELARLTQLTYLSIAQNLMVTDEAYGSLAQMLQMRHLNLSGTSMSIPSAKFVARLPELRSLSIYGLAGGRSQAEMLADEFPQMQLAGAQQAKRYA
jgi:hypothetical protein